MANLSQRIKELVQAIGADIKAITAKTSLLKTAAYRDTGRGVDRVPVFESIGGLAGYGYGGTLKPFEWGSLTAVLYDSSTYAIKNIPRYQNELPAGLDYNRAVSAVIEIKVIEAIANGPIVKTYQYLTIGFYEGAANTTIATKIMKFSRTVAQDEFVTMHISPWVADGGAAAAAEVPEVPKEAVQLDEGADLNTLPAINAVYTAAQADGILNIPADLAAYIFQHRFILEQFASTNSYSLVVQKLTVNAFPLSGIQSTNTVEFIRSTNYQGFSPWVRLTGELLGVDVTTTEPVGGDLTLNSLKVGPTSPKIAFEIVRMDVTYANAGYAEDGIGFIGSYDARGAMHLFSTVREPNIISVDVNVFAKSYGTDYTKVVELEEHGGSYFKIRKYGNYVAVDVKTAAHSAELGEVSNSGQNLFDKEGYVEMFITYKVD